MFTGIIQAKAPIVHLVSSAHLIQYGIAFPATLLNGLILGASVAVNGICQTVRTINNNIITFDAIKETIRCTTVSEWKIGDEVNIERSLKMGDEIGGHLLSGHILGTATVHTIEPLTAGQTTLTIACPASYMKYLFTKGYIAINGVSLTLGKIDLERYTFEVHLIPETQQMTTLGNAYPGEKVNIEIDSQTKTIVDTMERARL